MIIGEYKSGGFIKGLTAERLIELLRTLPPETLIVPNRVGNLSLCDSDFVNNGEMIGWIDMLHDGEMNMQKVP